MARKKTTKAHDASRFAPLSEADIKAQTDDGSFSRGRTYFRHGNIHETVLRNGALEALCEGSDFEPYHVNATLAPPGDAGANPSDFSCTCPRGGFCKHIVALLLTWIHDPGHFETRPPVADQLGDRSREDLIALVERMVQRYPDLERLVELPLPVAPGDVGAGSANDVSVDEATIRKQVRSALAGASYHDYDRGWGNDWGSGWSVPPELNLTLELGQSYVTAGQWGNAHVVLAAMAGEVLEESEEWMFTSDEEGALGGIVIACDAGLAACLDAQVELTEEDRLSGETREQLIQSLYDIWRYDVFEFGGYDLSQVGPEAIARNATAAERAMVEGWLRAIEFGENLGDQPLFAADWHKRSVVAFLSMLREVDGASDEDVIALYQEAELWDDVARLLLEAGCIDGAVAVAARHIRIAPNLIAFANAMIARSSDHAGRAIALVDDLAWEMEGGNVAHDATLQNWLIDQYSRHDRPRDALRLAERRFERQPTLQTYYAVRDAAGLPGQPEGIWDDLRPKMQAHLGKQQVWAVLADIHLEENDVAAALDAFDKRGEQRQPGTWALAWGSSEPGTAPCPGSRRRLP